jgi:hypothetical protein
VSRRSHVTQWILVIMVVSGVAISATTSEPWSRLGSFLHQAATVAYIWWLWRAFFSQRRGVMYVNVFLTLSHIVFWFWQLFNLLFRSAPHM